MKLTALEIEDRLYDLQDGYDDQPNHGWITFGLDQNLIIEAEPTESGVCRYQQSRSMGWSEVFSG